MQLRFVALFVNGVLETSLPVCKQRHTWSFHYTAESDVGKKDEVNEW